jgi:hypothetical protein
MLESIARGPLKTDTAVRAAMYLARDHGRDDLRALLRGILATPARGELRGIAAAALYDLGERKPATAASDELVASRQLSTVAWGALLRVADARNLDRVLIEPHFRRVQLGWLE